MTPEQFKFIWTTNGDSLTPLSINKLIGLKLLPETADFLTIAGLPFDAAPFLSFMNEKDYTIRKLNERFDFLGIDFDKYLMIGTTGDGDIIAINTDKNDQIEWLSHENNFSTLYFNSSINTLAACLLIYKDFIATILMENGENAYLDSEFSDAQFEKLKADLSNADKRATAEGFWKEQLDTVLINRKFYRESK